MLVLSRKTKRKPEDDPKKASLTITKDGQLVGTVQLLYANGGLCRLGFDFDGDYIIKRDELCELGDGGKIEAAA